MHRLLALAICAVVACGGRPRGPVAPAPGPEPNVERPSGSPDVAADGALHEDGGVDVVAPDGHPVGPDLAPVTDLPEPSGPDVPVMTTSGTAALVGSLDLQRFQ